eukprot:364809-Chlamydomonas_euryale.AAC.4
MACSALGTCPAHHQLHRIATRATRALSSTSRCEAPSSVWQAPSGGWQPPCSGWKSCARFWCDEASRGR